jgi:hypothetical protein
MAITRVTNALFPLASDYIRFPIDNEFPPIKNGFHQVSFLQLVNNYLIAFIESSNAANYWSC